MEDSLIHDSSSCRSNGYDAIDLKERPLGERRSLDLKMKVQ